MQSRICSACGGHSEAAQIILLKAVDDGTKRLRAAGVSFVGRHEAPQHFFLCRWECRVFRKDEQRP